MVRESAAAAKAMQPELKISLHGIPWMENDYDHGLRVIVGQDLEKLAPYVDIFGPICYFQMLHRPPEWVHDVVADYFRLTGKAPLPSVQASGSRRDPVAVETIRKHFLAGFESRRLPASMYSSGTVFGTIPRRLPFFRRLHGDIGFPGHRSVNLLGLYR
jgi:hypothetical protein